MRQHTLEQPIIKTPRPPHRLQNPFRVRHFASLFSLIGILALWQITATLKLYPPFIIPPPMAVLAKFQAVLANGTLWLHVQTTLGAVLVGIIVGVSVGVTLGYLIAKSSFLDYLISPLIAGFQSVPVVAYAPLLILWFGSGPTSKVITCALIVFFPVLLNTIVGIRNVPSSLRDLMLSLRATRWQMFTKLEVPAALPILFSGLKISASLAVIGAVVGEFVSANAGLGFLLTIARSQFDTPLVIVAVLTLAIISQLLYSFVSLVESRMLAWQRQSRRG